MTELASEEDFITIDKRETLISILNLSISLSDIRVTDLAKDSKKRNYPFFFTLTFDNFVKSESDQEEKISVHFIDTEVILINTYFLILSLLTLVIKIKNFFSLGRKFHSFKIKKNKLQYFIQIEQSFKN